MNLVFQIASLRGAQRRGNPDGRMDCHVAALLAMTMICLVFPKLLTAE
jgi:hypothetical protein